MVLNSKFAYGSQLSGEKNDLRIRFLVAEISSKPSLIFFGTPCTYSGGLLVELVGEWVFELKIRICSGSVEVEAEAEFGKSWNPHLLDLKYECIDFLSCSLLCPLCQVIQ